MKYLFFTLLLCVLPSVVSAQDFIVGPTKVELSLLPGGQASTTVTLVNRFLTSTRFDFEVKGVVFENNEVVFVPSGQGYRDASSFLAYPQDDVVGAGNQAAIPLKVSVPNDIKPGTYVASLLVGPESTEEVGRNVASESRIAVLVFVRVAGEVREEGQLASFSKGEEGDNSNLSFEITFANTGDTQLNPYGVLTLHSLFGKELASVEIDPWYVLPQTERTRRITVENAPQGFFIARVYLNPGFGSETDTESLLVVRIPRWIEILALVSVVMCIYVGVRKYSSRVAQTLVLVAMCATTLFVHGQVMQSTTYRLQSDSINFGGGRSSSASYGSESTFGEVATGVSDSTSYRMKAGYQQMQEVYIAMTAPADVTLAPAIGSFFGGTSDGATEVTVTTDGYGGYALSVLASTSPALQSAQSSFADYGPSSPTLGFSVAPTQSAFGFSPEGVDIASAFRDDGAVCGSGLLDTALACWDGMSTVSKTVAVRNSANNPAGSVTTLRLRAIAGSQRQQPEGNYSGRITFIAVAQ